MITITYTELSWMLGIVDAAIIVLMFIPVRHYHAPDDFIKSYGCLLKSRCKKCKEEIMLDSQGNWF